MNTRIVFITNILRQPRCIRRINDFIENGYDIKVYGYDRKGDNRALPNFHYNCIGYNSIGDSYVKRMLNMRRAISKIIAEEGRECIYYIFSLDNAMAASSVCRNLRYIYEISDLMELQISNKILSSLLVYVNRLIVKKSLLTVYTSDGFVNFLNPKGALQNKTVVLPNKLNKLCKEKFATKEKIFDINNIRFGFTGAIRTETLYNLVKAIGKYGKHEVHLYGIYAEESNGEYSIKKLVDQYTNVFYHGPFKNPNDLSEIYKNIDIVLCYYRSSRNDLYLEPNKLYEAIFYDCPIIVAAETFVGEKVKKLNIGYTISRGSESSLLEFIDSITLNNFEEKVDAIKKINKNGSS